jgi:hypothetical protein
MINGTWSNAELTEGLRDSIKESTLKSLFFTAKSPPMKIIGTSRQITK